MRRRTFVTATLAALCSPFAGAYVSGFDQDCGVATGNRTHTIEFLRRLVGDPESAAWIGRRYLAMPGAHTELGRLLGDPCMHFLQPPHTGSSSTLTDAFQAQRACDFLSGDVIVLDNWVLARSEVHVCAALALLQGGSAAK